MAAFREALAYDGVSIKPKDEYLVSDTAATEGELVLIFSQLRDSVSQMAVEKPPTGESTAFVIWAIGLPGRSLWSIYVDRNDRVVDARNLQFDSLLVVVVSLDAPFMTGRPIVILR